MGTEKRLVTVTAVVVTEGPEGIAVSYAAVAEALRAHVVHALAAGTRHSLLPAEYPLVRFEARSEPVPDGEAAGLSVTDLREMLDEATRAMQIRAGDIRSRAGLEPL